MTARTGSPVRTGIDLVQEAQTIEDIGFPRTHGDRPKRHRISSVEYEVPPYARG